MGIGRPLPASLERGGVSCAALAFGLLVALLATPAHAQAWSALDVPDSALASSIRALGAGYEKAWNALLVEALRAGDTSSSGRRLWRLARATAWAEGDAGGGRIGSDALALAGRWTMSQRAVRVRAAVAESVATAAQNAHDWTPAERSFRDALADYRALGERRRTAWVLGSLGVVMFSSGRLAQADSAYREALAARRALGDAKMIGNTLNVLGSTNLRLGRFADALPWLREARAVRMGTGERGPLGATLNYLGAAAQHLEMPDSARKWYAEALSLTSEAGDSTRTAEVLTNLAQFERDQGRPAHALPLLERALAISLQGQDPAAASLTRVKIADLLANEGRFAESADEAHRAWAAASAAADPRKVQDAALAEGRAWVRASDPTRAREPLRVAAALADSMGEARLVAPTAVLEAQRSRLDDDLPAAWRGMRRALDSAVLVGDSSQVHDACALAGQLAQTESHWDLAEHWYLRAEAIGATMGPVAHASDLLNLGQIRSTQGRVAEAREALRAARALSDSTGDPDLAWLIELALGDAAEHAREPRVALTHYRAAAELADALRARQRGESAIAVFADRGQAFEGIVRLLGTLDDAERGRGYGEEAFGWAERGKARALLSLLARTGSAGMTLRPASLADAQRRLPARGTALLAYAVGDSGSDLWVVRHDRWRRFTLPGKARLRTSIAALRSAWGAGGEEAAADGARRLARELSAELWSPAAPLLAGVKRVVIAPDGPLWLLPLEALPMHAGSARDDAPWAKRFDVSYVPAAALLGHEAGGHDARVVAVGDIDYGSGPVSDGQPLPGLAGTALELAALRTLCPGPNYTALTGSAATRDSLLALVAARVRILHLATHGDPLEAEPERSALWLAAGTGPEPTRLEARDVLQRSVGGDLVTLAACGSGLGRVAHGEGMLGLTRAFLAAGSGAVVVSLWSVSDRSTAELMRRFYTGLLERHLPRDRALADAKRALLARSETTSPYYWAPFVLVGGTSPLAR